MDNWTIMKLKCVTVQVLPKLTKSNQCIQKEKQAYKIMEKLKILNRQHYTGSSKDYLYSQLLPVFKKF